MVTLEELQRSPARDNLLISYALHKPLLYVENKQITICGLPRVMEEKQQKSLDLF